MKPLHHYTIALMLITSSHILYAQTFRHYLDTTKQHYIGIKGSAQLWMRATQLNPGTIINGTEKDYHYDISVRRLRFQIYGQITDRLSFVVQAGQNNMNFNTRESNLKLLDVYACYSLTKAINIGVGKSAWVGLSRYASPATSSQLSSDISYNALPLINIYDDMMRRPSLFLYGKTNKIDYRAVLATPYNTNSELNISSTKANPAMHYSSVQLSSYIKFQFRDTEAQKSAFAPATYGHNKNIFNIGIGELYQNKAMCILSGTDTLYKSIHMEALDVFGHMPLTSKSSITFYAAYIHSHLGKGYIRNIGANAVSASYNENVAFNGAGNRYPAAGSGEIIEAQLGILKTINQHSYQPSISIQYADYDALNSSSLFYDFSLNTYLPDGHSKITFGYQNRPVFYEKEKEITAEKRRGLLLIQYQIKLG